MEKKILEKLMWRRKYTVSCCRTVYSNAYEEGYSKEAIVLGLESDIYGAEIVKTTYDKCIENLDNIAKSMT